ncbi:hypothetical protein B0H19DRAFT_1057173 [Mycena capillaripes]|nr:hypothetical protein B0H19DRAFT_1057173 [Mycena capillaripes]
MIIVQEILSYGSADITSGMLESQYTVNATTFTQLWDDVVVDMFGTWVSIFLYGEKSPAPYMHTLICGEASYLNLFFVAIYTLARRQTAGKKVLLGFAWATAVLGTTQMALRLSTTAMTVRILQQFIEQKPSSISGALETSGTLGLAQRFLVVSTFALGCVSVASSSSSSVALPLTQQNPAGRIWWIRRDILYMDINGKIENHYSRVIAMMYGFDAEHIILLATTTQVGIVFNGLEATAMHLVVSKDSFTYSKQC